MSNVDQGNTGDMMAFAQIYKIQLGEQLYHLLQGNHDFFKFLDAISSCMLDSYENNCQFFFTVCRLTSPRFADGLTAPRISITGRDLPLSRVVSRTMHPDEGYHDHAGTVMVIAWGQFMDHDYTLTATPLGIFFKALVFMQCYNI